MAFLGVIIGIIFIVGSICMLLRNNKLSETGEHTTATVIRTEKRAMGSGSYTNTYIPILEYTANGVKYTINHPRGNAQPKYQDGETFDIIYDKHNPKKMLIVGDKTHIVVLSILIPIGVIFLIGALSHLLS